MSRMCMSRQALLAEQLKHTAPMVLCTRSRQAQLCWVQRQQLCHRNSPQQQTKIRQDTSKSQREAPKRLLLQLTRRLQIHRATCAFSLKNCSTTMTEQVTPTRNICLRQRMTTIQTANCGSSSLLVS